MEEIRWYEKLNYTETKDIIKEKLQNMSRDFVAIGFYLKLIRDKSLFLEDGYKSIWEFAEDNYGIKRSTASRWMAMNDRFSKNGNTPILSEEYISFGKSQLQEMLYLNDKQMEEVKPDMTAREIRGIRTPDPEPEEIEEQIPEQVLGQMCLEDYPEILPEEKHGPAKCITGKSKSGICGAAAYCSENYSCCLECDQNCNSRCGFTSVNWGSVGMNIIKGIASGLTGAASAIVEAAKSAANKALDAAKSALGIHSPSRVFRDQVGKMMALGMGIGFEKNIPIKSMNVGVQRAVSGLHKSVDLALSARTADKTVGRVKNYPGFDGGKDIDYDRLEKIQMRAAEKMAKRPIYLGTKRIDEPLPKGAVPAL